jgi:hypothetical protein
METHFYFILFLFVLHLMLMSETHDYIKLKDWITVNIEIERMWQKCCQIEILVARFIQGIIFFLLQFITG